MTAMTMMSLRSGWKTSNPYPSGWRWFHRVGEDWSSPYAVDTGGGRGGGRVFAYANGNSPQREFPTVREAHAYLLSVGSESPWEEV
jgi:hypothetical protein